ncbi:MAG: hypothetical protein AB1401_03645 [Thermodesulfobacteriota bacterium]
MTVLNFIIAIIALVVAVLAYNKAGGVADLKKQIESLGPLREKAADILAKFEKGLRKEGTEEKPEEKGEETINKQV